jgi:hypothetical protein
MSLDIARLRLDSGPLRAMKFMDQRLEEVVEKVVLVKIRGDMENKNMSDRVMNAVTFEKTGFLKGKIVFELEGDNKEPLDEFIENGFKPHVIKAKGKAVGGSDVLVSKAGEFFGPEVKHPGFEGHKFMRTAETFYVPLIKQRLIELTNEDMVRDKVG